MKDNGGIDLSAIILMIFVISLVCIAAYLVGGESSRNEENNVHYTKVITPVYIDGGTIIDDGYNKYHIIESERYPSGKNFSLNKYRINNAIINNKNVTLIIQTICLPLDGCTDVVSNVN